MSKEAAEMKALIRSPKALMDYQLLGKRPKAVQPHSPLITYLESKSPRARLEMRNVRLSPKLGYASGAAFANAEQLLRYLKPNQWVVGSWPAESYRIKSFYQRIDDALFQSVQAQHCPSQKSGIAQSDKTESQL